MANASYPLGLKAFADGGVDWTGDTIRAVAVSSAYTYDSADQYYSDLAGILGTADLASKSSTGGVLDAADTQLTGLSAGAIDAIIICKWTGSAATSALLFYFDTGLNFGATPTGDPLIVWPNASGIKIYPLGGVAS